MEKRKFEDIKINNKKITNIKKSDVSIDYLPRITNYTKYEETNIQTNSYPNLKRNKKKGSFLPIFLITLFLILGYLASVLFENTKVEIENKKQSFNIENKEFKASKDLNTDIPFEIMIVEDEEFKNITLSDTQEASTKSKGEILFYNEYSTTPQKLLSNTYIKDEEGKLYTLDKEVIIPGYTLDKDKKVIPGTAEVTASSFLIGESYNGEPKEFTVNSFKGTTKLNKIYARAKTPFEGGVLGLVYVLNANDKGILSSYAATSFKNNLYRKVGAEIPEGYILYPNAISFTYNINENSFFKDKNASVPINGSLSAVILKKSDLSKALINNLLPKISNKEFNEIQVLNLDNLKFNFSVKDQPITKDLISVSFTLTGTLNFIWNIDPFLIQSKLAGVPKESVEALLKEDPGIKNAIVKLFPPWASNLPKDVSKINIKIE